MMIDVKMTLNWSTCRLIWRSASLPPSVHVAIFVHLSWAKFQSGLAIQVILQWKGAFDDGHLLFSVSCQQNAGGLFRPLLGANGKRWSLHARRRAFDIKRSSFDDYYIVILSYSSRMGNTYSAFIDKRCLVAALVMLRACDSLLSERGSIRSVMDDFLYVDTIDLFYSIPVPHVLIACADTRSLIHALH